MSDQIDASADAACLNCGARVTAAYCGVCGQKTRVHRTLSDFWHDALHSVLHFDGKIWRTLPLLAWHPGQLTRRYVHGERAKFVSPLALFLFCVFVAVAVFGGILPKAGEADRPTIEAIEQRAAKASADIEAKIDRLRIERAHAGTDAAELARLDGEINALATAKAQALDRPRQIKAAEVRIAAENRRSAAAVASLEARLAEAKKSGAATQAIENELAAAKADQRLMVRAADLLIRDTLDGGVLRVEFGSELWSIKASEATNNPQLLLYKLQSNAYKFAWALIPLSVPFVWLLFCWKREYKLFDHAVFVTYSMSFMLLLATVLAVVMQVPALDAAGGLAMLFIPPLHMYRQVRHAYALTRAGAAWRTALLLMFAATALGVFGALIVMLGIAR